MGRGGPYKTKAQNSVCLLWYVFSGWYVSVHLSTSFLSSKPMEICRLPFTSEMSCPLLKYKNKKKVEILLGWSYCVRNSKGRRHNIAGYYFRLGIKEVLEIQRLPKSSVEGARCLQKMCPTHPLLLRSVESRTTLWGTSWPWNSTGSIKDASAFVWCPPDLLFLSPDAQNRTFISQELISDSGLVLIWSRNPLWRSNWLLCKGFRSYMLRIMTLFGVKKQCQENS